MERQEVFNMIDDERSFQDIGKKNPASHIVEDFPLGSALSAIQHKLEIARLQWYNTTTPHENAMHQLRKIAAMCVQMGEKYGMPGRYLADEDE